MSRQSVTSNTGNSLFKVVNLNANFGFSFSCSLKHALPVRRGLLAFDLSAACLAQQQPSTSSALCLLPTGRQTFVTGLWEALECVTITFPFVMSFVWTVLINNDPNNQACRPGVLVRPVCFWALAMEGMKLVLSFCAGLIDCCWMRSSFISR